MLWVHFTKEPWNFKLDTGTSFGGLLIYKMSDDQNVDEKSAKWNRLPVYIECDERYVDLEQTDPLGGDPTWDEYLIPDKYLSNARIV